MRTKRVAPTMKLLDALSGRVTRSARFREYVDQSFAEVDHNANGSGGASPRRHALLRQAQREG
jgi:hypothetical protein